MNKRIRLLSLAARTAATESADQLNRYHRGCRVHINVTDDPAAASVTFTIQGKHLNGEYYTVLASAAIAAVGDTVLTVYPGAPVTTNVSANAPLPPVWRVIATPADTDALTYEVTAELLD